MTPKDLTKPISQIKPPGIRGWIISLLIAISVLSGVVIVLWKNSKGDCDETKAENARLNKWKFDHLEEDNQRLTKRNQFMDSMILLSNKLLKDTK